MPRRKKHYYVYLETVDDTGHFMAHATQGESFDNIKLRCEEVHKSEHPGNGKAATFISRTLTEEKYNELYIAIDTGNYDPEQQCPITGI